MSRNVSGKASNLLSHDPGKSSLTDSGKSKERMKTRTRYPTAEVIENIGLCTRVFIGKVLAFDEHLLLLCWPGQPIIYVLL
jgi:hypothetical protein